MDFIDLGRKRGNLAAGSDTQTVRNWLGSFKPVGADDPDGTVRTNSDIGSG